MGELHARLSGIHDCVLSDNTAALCFENAKFCCVSGRLTCSPLCVGFHLLEVWLINSKGTTELLLLLLLLFLLLVTEFDPWAQMENM